MRRQAGQKQNTKQSKISLRVKFLLLDETLDLDKKIAFQSTVRDLKCHIELATGIPFELQQLSYLDAGALKDDQIIKNIEIVPNAIIHLNVWHTWKEIVEASCLNEIEHLFAIGVTQDSTFQTATSEYMLPKQRRDWLQHRASVALFIASQRDHYEMARRLLQSGASANCQTGAGRTPLHVAAAKDNLDIVDLLLANGADIDLADFGDSAAGGRTALALAAAAGHKACERRLFTHRWERRAFAPKSASTVDVGGQQQQLFEFQRSDSSNPRWRVGPHAQVYMEATTASSSATGASRGASGAIGKPAAVRGAEGEPANASGESYDSWSQRKIQQRQKLASSQDALARSRLPTIDVGANKKQPKRIQQQQQQQQQSKHAEESLLSKLIEATADQLDIQQQQQQHRRSAAVSISHLSTGQSDEPVAEAGPAPMIGRRRGPVDPQLNAYEQWLKDRSEGDNANDTTVSPGNDSSAIAAAAADSAQLLPYQLMIEEFCREKCTNLYF